MKHKFVGLAGGIHVRAGQRLSFVSWIAYNDGHNRCFYSESGDRPSEVANPDMDLFEVVDSPLSSNSTRVNRGICPGLLYALA